MSENKDNGKQVGAYTQFGWFLRTARNSIGVKTQKEMAKAIGYSEGFLSDLEKGTKGDVDIDFLLRCRDYFGWGIQEGDSQETSQYKIGKTFELFEKGLMYNSENISLDMKYFQGIRKDGIVKAILFLLFMPDIIPTMTVLMLDGKSGMGGDDTSKQIEEIASHYHRMEQLCLKYAHIKDLESPPPRSKKTRTRTRKKGGTPPQ